MSNTSHSLSLLRTKLAATSGYFGDGLGPGGEPLAAFLVALILDDSFNEVDPNVGLAKDDGMK